MPLETPSYLQCALVTGASSGLGAEFAYQIAPLTEHLILVARRKEKLIEVYSQISIDYPNLKISIFTCDLSDEADRIDLFSQLEEAGIKPTLLINNAGLGDYGTFHSSDWDKVQSMMEVNMTALTHLTHHFLTGMKELGTGAILNVSSLASVVPVPDFTVYAATKAYVTSFSEGLRSELQEENIPVIAVCPGPVHTEFSSVAAREEYKFETKGYEQLRVTSQDVVTESLNALFQNQARVYPGWKVAVFAAVLTALPMFAVRYFNSKRPRRSVSIHDESEQKS